MTFALADPGTFVQVHKDSATGIPPREAREPVGAEALSSGNPVPNPGLDSVDIVTVSYET